MHKLLLVGTVPASIICGSANSDEQ